MSIRKAVSALAVLALALVYTSVFARDGREEFREFVKKNEEAIVTLEIVMNVKYAGGGGQHESEEKAEGIGVVLDKEGLVVTALSQIDPGSFYAKYTGNEDQYVTRVVSIRYILPNNEEIDAGVILRDPDLDLIFLRPTESLEEEMAFIPLSSAVDAEILDPVYTIGRMGRIGRRSIVAMTGEVQSIIEKPRKLYITDSEIATAGAGAPVFTAEGKLIGIQSYYVFPGGQKALGSSDQPYIPVIVPTSSVKEVADQTEGAEPEAAPEEAAETE